jgi:hypothetical protein
MGLHLKEADGFNVEEEQYTVLLSDYSFTPPAKILERLKAGMQDMGGMSMKKMPATQKLYAQKWDESGGFVRTVTEGGLPDTDVKYDALLANRRTKVQGLQGGNHS